MRLIHKVPFSPQEIENYRQLVFNNLTHGLQSLLEAMEDMNLEVTEENVQHIPMIEEAPDIRDAQKYNYQSDLYAATPICVNIPK